MATKLKLFFAATLAILCGVGQIATQVAQAQVRSQNMIETYSQKILLKNWALSVCLAEIAKNVSDRQDANATASAYLEYGNQRLEAYNSLRKLAEEYAHQNYGGSIQSQFNTMKCIDLFHSKALDDMTNKLINSH